MFAEAMADDAKAEGKRTQWLETHNAYTQISSEMGIPGLLLYLAVLIGSYRSTNSVIKMSKLRTTERWNAIGNTASCMRMSLFAYAVTALFSSVAYQSLLPTLAGLSTVLYLSARREMEQDTAAAVLTPVVFPSAMRPVTAAPRLQNVGWQRS
jgi:hypothetical protein